MFRIQGAARLHPLYNVERGAQRRAGACWAWSLQNDLKTDLIICQQQQTTPKAPFFFLIRALSHLILPSDASGLEGLGFGVPQWQQREGRGGKLLLDSILLNILVTLNVLFIQCFCFHFCCRSVAGPWTVRCGGTGQGWRAICWAPLQHRCGTAALAVGCCDTAHDPARKTITKEQAKQPFWMRVVPHLLLILFSSFSAPRLPHCIPGWAIVQLYIVPDPKSQSLRACCPPLWHSLSLLSTQKSPSQHPSSTGVSK